MKFFVLGLMLFSILLWGPEFSTSSAQTIAQTSIASSDPDFSIVLFPDTQYYQGQNAYVFRDSGPSQLGSAEPGRSEHKNGNWHGGHYRRWRLSGR
jgi:hypothetical protein